MSLVDPLVRTALDAADAAGRVHLRWAGRVDMGGAEVKGFGDFVSDADRESQEAALAVIEGRFPDHRVLAEEGNEEDRPGWEGATPVWIVDPLDGTTNFLHGIPVWAASVAVAVQGEVVAAAVSCPPTGERWWARRGQGAWKNGRRIRVSGGASGVRSLEEAVVGTGFPFRRLHLLARYQAQFRAILEAGAGIRRAGAAAIDLCWLAEGRFDAFWELHLNPWDFAGGILVVEEAGGVVARPDRSPLELTPGGVLAANSPGLRDELGELLDAAGG
jgi:myo-inositol-1(or 4)-monophosphatase